MGVMGNEGHCGIARQMSSVISTCQALQEIFKDAQRFR